MTQNLAASPVETPALSMGGMRRDLAAARDTQLLQVVAMVDLLADRGQADALIAPVRRRLRDLRPDRKLKFTRLLFLPLDKLIVAPRDWHEPDGRVPRSALAALSTAILDSLKAQETATALADIDRLTAGVTVADTGAVRRAGALLWPLAGAALHRLADLPPPHPWTLAGLKPAVFQPLAKGIATILAAASRLKTLADGLAPAGQRDDELAALLREAETQGGHAWGMLLSLVLLEFPTSQAPVAAAAAAARRADRAFRQASMAAIETALGGIETASVERQAPVSENSAGELGLNISLLDRLSELPGDKVLQTRVAEARTKLQQDCVSRFDAELRHDFAASLKTLAEMPSAPDAAIEAIEATLRCLRRFETEARRLGGGAHYDSELQATAAMVAAIEGLDRIDRARLIELLAGSEAALRVLRGAA